MGFCTYKNRFWHQMGGGGVELRGGGVERKSGVEKRGKGVESRGEEEEEPSKHEKFVKHFSNGTQTVLAK